MVFRFIILYISITLIHESPSFANVDHLHSGIRTSRGYPEEILRISITEIGRQKRIANRSNYQLLTKPYDPDSYRFHRSTEHSNFLIRPDRKSRLSVITIHGLFDRGRQFIEMGEFLSLSGEINWFNVVLPGHGHSADLDEKVTFKDWEDEVNTAVDLAARTSDKIIIVGQSTGGLLAFNAALRGNKKIVGLVLVEPAFRVNSAIVLGSCAGQYFSRRSSDLLGLAKLLGLGTLAMRDVALQMGCQVDRLRLAMEDRYQPIQSKGVSYFDGEGSADFKKFEIEELFGKVQMPALVLNRPNDEIVNYTAVKKYALANQRSDYRELSPELPHGSLDLNPRLMAGGLEVAEFIFKFLPTPADRTIKDVLVRLEQKCFIDAFESGLNTVQKMTRTERFAIGGDGKCHSLAEMESLDCSLAVDEYLCQNAARSLWRAYGRTPFFHLIKAPQAGENNFHKESSENPRKHELINEDLHEAELSLELMKDIAREKWGFELVSANDVLVKNDIAVILSGRQLQPRVIPLSDYKRISIDDLPTPK